MAAGCAGSVTGAAAAAAATAAADTVTADEVCGSQLHSCGASAYVQPMYKVQACVVRAETWQIMLK
jgi:hypothetical protein